jgi:hypothetical protein
MNNSVIIFVSFFYRLNIETKMQKFRLFYVFIEYVKIYVILVIMKMNDFDHQSISLSRTMINIDM